MPHQQEVDLILDPNAEMSVEMTVAMTEEMVAGIATIAMTAGQGMIIGLIGSTETVLIAALTIGLDVDRNAVQNQGKKPKF